MNLTQLEHLRSISRISQLRHHAVESGEIVRNDLPVIVVAPDAHDRTSVDRPAWLRAKRWPMPDGLLLNLGVQAERGGTVGLRKSHVDQITEFIACEAKTKADRVLSSRALNRIVTLFHRARD